MDASEVEEDEERRRRGWKIEGWIILSQRAEVSELSGKKKNKKRRSSGAELGGRTLWKPSFTLTFLSSLCFLSVC